MGNVLDGEILAAEEESRRSERVKRGFWRMLGKAAGRIPFADEVVAGHYCALDPATPAPVRAALMAALAYFVLPADAIPDMLLGVGFTDDVTVLAAVIATVGAHITPVHRQAAREALGLN
jgi:uncharacterized membrane protein YkvA (DUF1232 family)